MYYDNDRGSSQQRENWKYEYKGIEILQNAKDKFKEFRSKETKSREDVANLLKDPSVSHSDQRIKDLRNDIEFYGRNCEALEVFVHEFGRNPSRTFYLNLSDVVYFKLHKKG